MQALQNSESLEKPDMRAVLSRTHLQITLHNFLIPLFEAVSNAMHGIEDRFGDIAKDKGRIGIKFTSTNDPDALLISISDNGIGLDDGNYYSFKTPFSGHKLKRNGRGFGRFIAFKVFRRIMYSSRYEFMGTETDRCFRFDIYQDKEFIPDDGFRSEGGTGVTVEYNQPLPEWRDLIRHMSSDLIIREVANHFLPHFLYKWLPEISIQFDDCEEQSIRTEFERVFVESDKGAVVCEIDGAKEEVSYSLTKVPRDKAFPNHCLMFSAADRIVGAPRDLSKLLGRPFFIDEEGKPYVVIAVVRSDAFEKRLNDARTSINLAPKAIEDIISLVSDKIEKQESEQIERIKYVQETGLKDALRVNPILRLGLRGKSLSEYVSSKPNNWEAEDFISDLAIERSRATNAFAKQMAEAANSAENYEATIKKIVATIDETNKEALAEYVIHRKNVIELVEVARKHSADGKHQPEDVIHDLIFRRFTDNTALDFFEHNLWLVDDVLAFMPYISSDRTMHGSRRKKGDKVTDLAFFDDSMVLGDSDGTTATIVEFKRPSRNDYSYGDEKTDPVRQVIKTMSKVVDAGGISKTDGSFFSFVGVVRRFAFIIADHTPTLVQILREHDFKNAANPKIYTRYHENEKLFIQAFGYDTLVENAKKRNQAFFTVLFGE